MLAFCGLLAATAAAATPNPVIKLNNGVEMPQMAAGYARTPPCYIVTLRLHMPIMMDTSSYMAARAARGCTTMKRAWPTLCGCGQALATLSHSWHHCGARREATVFSSLLFVHACQFAVRGESARVLHDACFHAFTQPCSPAMNCVDIVLASRNSAACISELRPHHATLLCSRCAGPGNTITPLR
jgi:hypothetical protein